MEDTFREDSLFCGFSILPTKELLNKLNYLLFEIKNNNFNLEIEEDFSSLHITLFYSKSPMTFMTYQEMVSLASKVAPDDISLECDSFDFFGLEKDTLVIKINCPEIVEANKVLTERAKILGIEPTFPEFIPHITLGKVSKNNISLPTLTSLPLYVRALTFKKA